MLKKSDSPEFIAIIPARYASTRFPGKPLAMIGDKTMIECVYRRVAQVFSQLAVATDDQRIFDAVEAFGGKAVMTSTSHRSGTDRVREAYKLLGSKADVVVNVQGDEPFIAKSQLVAIKDTFSDPSVQIASLARPFPKDGSYESLEDSNLVKVVMDTARNALYFSRQAIPFLRGVDKHEWPSRGCHYTHVGLYAYRAEVLDTIADLPQSPLELAESLEQLRWLQNGYKIKMGITLEPTIGIDTPADLQEALRHIQYE